MKIPSGSNKFLQAEIDKLQKKVAALEEQLAHYQPGDSDTLKMDGLDENQKRLSEILEITSDLVSTATVDGKLTYLNSAGRIMIGWDIEEKLDGKRIADLHPVWALKQIETEGIPTATAFGSWEGETSILHRDGREIPVSQVILAHRSPDGVLQYFSTIIRNISDFKHLENALRESEEKYRHLFAVSPEALLFADTNTFELLEVNDAAVNLYGYPREELLKLRPMDLSAQPEATAQALKTGARKIPHRMHRRKDGTEFPVELTTSTFDWQGRRVQFGSVHDISERLMTEEKLLEQARELNAINTLGQAVNATLDADTIMKTALQEILNSVHPDLAFFFERDGEQLILKSVLPEESRQRLGDVPQHRIGECICGFAARQKKAVFSRNILNDNRCSWEECKRAGLKSFAALPLCSGEDVTGVIGLASDVERDFETNSGFLQTFVRQISNALINARLYQTAQQEISQRKQAAEVQRKSENLISSIYRAAPTGIGVVSNRILVTVNDRVCEMIGYSRDYLVGKSARVLYPTDEDFEYVGREKYLQIRERGTGTVETRWLRSDGQIIDVLMSSTPINLSDLTAGVTFTALDITEMKRIREELKSLNASLELKVAERTAQLVAANKELEAFSYTVSHDLRTPLRSISGYTNILLEESGAYLNDAGKHTCSLISGNVKKMGQLIDDLLAFSRLSRKETNITRIGMKALAQASFNELTTRFEKGRIDLEIGELEDCYGDKDMLRLVWNNLLDNAIKFSSKTDHPAISITSNRNDQKVIYQIKDNGAGFENNYKGKLFGVFQRLHNESEFDGTGVGLAIVQRIILRHGGEVGADGEVGKGAIFWFSIPDPQGINP